MCVYIYSVKQIKWSKWRAIESPRSQMAASGIHHAAMHKYTNTHKKKKIKLNSFPVCSVTLHGCTDGADCFWGSPALPVVLAVFLLP